MKKQQRASRMTDFLIVNLEMHAAILALANIMRIGVVVFTSLENFAVITIVRRNKPIACTTVYLAFEQLGAGHYDAVIESPVVSVETTFAYYKPSEDSTKPDIDDHSKAHSFHPACRCGQGAIKINRNENTVQSTSLVVNAFAV